MNESMRADLMRKTGLNAPRAYIERDRSGKAVGLSRAALSGRLVEFSGQGNLANLTLACGLLLDAQREGETAAWITGKGEQFLSARRGPDRDRSIGPRGASLPRQRRPCPCGGPACPFRGLRAFDPGPGREGGYSPSPAIPPGGSGPQARHGHRLPHREGG